MDSLRLIRLTVNFGFDDRHLQYIAVSTVPDDPASSIVDTIPVTANPLSPRNLELISLWRNSCDRGIGGHDKCSAATNQKTTLPTRVIAVESDGLAPRLHTSQGESGHYVTLSYCWGGPQPHQTTKARLSEYTRALPLDNLPASIKDAIQLARILRIPYLWVDSDEDKFHEIAQMAGIYQNSSLTIAAACASSCHEGFLGVQEKVRSRLAKGFKLPIANLEGGAIGTVMMIPSKFQYNDARGKDKMPLDSRGWTYQEILLSRRILSFHVNGVEWQCPSRIESDDMLQAEESSIGKSSSSSGRTTEAFHQLALAHHSKTLSGLWWTLVSDYTMGELTVLDDKLLALSAIASEFQRLRPDQYLAGLWRSTLIMDLLWSTRHEDVSNEERSVIKSRERDTKYPIPTWSWASLNRSRISHDTGSFDRPSARVNIRTCETFPVSAGAPFGLINGGNLILSAPLKKICVRDVWQHFCADVFQSFGSSHDRDIPKRLGSLFLDDAPHFGHLVGAVDVATQENEDLLACRLGLPCGEKTIWFLGLSRTDESEVETSGLALVKHGDGSFSRVGRFYVGPAFMNAEPTAVQQELMDRWGDDYAVTTISII